MSCNYCAGVAKKPLLNGDALIVCIKDDELDIYDALNSDREVARINFCPICGRNLFERDDANNEP